MECCNKCFTDIQLRKQITNAGASKQRCDRCGRNEVRVIDPAELSTQFDKVCHAYQRSKFGRSLFDLLNEDWLIFDLSYQQSKTLLGAILGSTSRAEDQYLATQVNYPESKELWNGFRKELIEENRFFFKTEFSNVHYSLSNFISYLLLPAFECQKDWYRARIQKDKKLIMGEMGMPPKELSSPGRANPVGIPYLYLGSSNKNVVNEVRPQIGDKVSVANFTLTKEVKIVDLRNPRKNLSPFQMENSDEVSELREYIALIEDLNSELSKPVQAGKANVDYIPSQYLCEFVKSLGYEGIVYDSSFGNGTNLALFAEENAKIKGEETDSVQITGYEFSE